MLILCLVIALIMTTGCAGGTAGDTDGSSDGTGNDPASEAGAGASVTEGTYSYETVEFSVPSTDGAKKDIYGVFYIPKGAGDKLPTVIFSHGYGGTHRVGVPYAEALAGQGYAVYCFDFRGGSPESRSGGSTLEMSVFTELEDLEQVIGAVEEQDFVDDENLFLMGTSQGGAVSAMAGARHEDRIKGMVLLYPAFVLADRAVELFGTAENIPETYTFMHMKVGREYFDLTAKKTTNLASTNATTILQFSVPIPPLTEQEKIIAILDRNTATINEVIAEKETLVSDLESYKKSLIYEVVTGKRRVC